MKTLITTLILFSGLSVFASVNAPMDLSASNKEQLTYDLIVAAKADNVATAIRLLDQGADPVRAVTRDGKILAPALYEAALSGARFGKDAVYQELVHHRSVSLNTAVDFGWGEPFSVLEYLFSEVGPDKAKFEPFFLKMLKDGADPFALSPYSNSFAYFVFGDYTAVVSKLMKKEIRKESWLWYTHHWSMRYKNFAGEQEVMQKLMAQLDKYYPILKAAGISIDQWGFYGKDPEHPGPVLLQRSVALEFVRYRFNSDFIKAFIARGFDVNKAVEKGNSMCELANVISVQDVEALVGFGCKVTNYWTLSALFAEQFRTAEKVLSLGIDIDQPVMIYGKSYTVLTYLRSLSSKPKLQIDWALKHGANPNQPQPE